MTIQSIGPPPLTKSKDNLLDRWLQLFWENQRNISPISGDSIVANEVFLPHAPAPTQANAIAADAQLQLGNRAFMPHANQVQQSTTDTQNLIAVEAFIRHPSVPYLNLTAIDSTSILAGQIFGS